MKLTATILATAVAAATLAGAAPVPFAITRMPSGPRTTADLARAATWNRSKSNMRGVASGFLPDQQKMFAGMNAHLQGELRTLNSMGKDMEQYNPLGPGGHVKAAYVDKLNGLTAELMEKDPLAKGLRVTNIVLGNVVPVPI